MAQRCVFWGGFCTVSPHLCAGCWHSGGGQLWDRGACVHRWDHSRTFQGSQGALRLVGRGGQSHRWDHRDCGPCDRLAPGRYPLRHRQNQYQRSSSATSKIPSKLAGFFVWASCCLSCPLYCACGGALDAWCALQRLEVRKWGAAPHKTLILRPYVTTPCEVGSMKCCMYCGPNHLDGMGGLKCSRLIFEMRRLPQYFCAVFVLF